jgi:TRAP-type mannitol/chloroaromatic compound transport system substrate-binding protein
MRRRELLIGAGSWATGATSNFPAPAIAQGIRELKMATAWPKDTPGLATGAERLARTITKMTDGRLTVTVYPGNSLVPPFEAFDAVGAGVVDLYHSNEQYFESKTRALNFFSAVPYGLNANELSSWLHSGGGQALWDEVNAPFGVKPLLAGNAGVQMGGWFTKEITGPEDFRGLRYRMPGLGAEVLRRMGAIVVSLPGGEIVGALQSGAIDASEWVSPWLDTALGLDKAASYYYYPGFHEPGTGISLGVNKRLWEGLTPFDRGIIEAAATAEVTTMLAEFNAGNAKALKALRKNQSVKILRFDDKLITTFGKFTREVLADVAGNDALTRKVYESYMTFLADIMDWEEVAEHAYLDSRRLALSAM